jgi:hypothetical protein
MLLRFPETIDGHLAVSRSGTQFGERYSTVPEPEPFDLTQRIDPAAKSQSPACGVVTKDPRCPAIWDYPLGVYGEW